MTINYFLEKPVFYPAIGRHNTAEDNHWRSIYPELWSLLTAETMDTRRLAAVVPADLPDAACRWVQSVSADRVAVIDAERIKNGQESLSAAHKRKMQQKRDEEERTQNRLSYIDSAEKTTKLVDILGAPRDFKSNSVVKWAVGAVAAPRRDSTIEQCMRSFERAGFGLPRLFLDNGLSLPPGLSDAPHTVRDTQLGAWPNYWAGLAELVQRSPNADAYLMLEDDALIYSDENVREYLEKWVLWPTADMSKLGYVSLHCSAVNDNDPSRPSGWFSVHGFTALAIAYVFSNACAKAFLNYSIETANDYLEKRLYQDTVASVWAHRHGRRSWLATPSLTTHEGAYTTVWPNLQNRVTNKGGRNCRVSVSQAIDDAADRQQAFLEGSYKPNRYSTLYKFEHIGGREEGIQQAAQICPTRTAKPTIIKSRRSTCVNCPHLSTDLGLCVIDGQSVLAKTRDADTRCPIGRWAEGKPFGCCS